MYSSIQNPIDRRSCRNHTIAKMPNEPRTTSHTHHTHQNCWLPSSCLCKKMTLSPPFTRPKATRPQPMPTRVYVRIRPESESGGHASVALAAANSNSINAKEVKAHQKLTTKALHGWSDDSVTLSTQYTFSKGKACYDFPQRVLGPTTTQAQAYEEMNVASLVEEFTTFGGRNVMMFAYGQTGSGKTHTMLGTDKSLRWCGGDDISNTYSTCQEDTATKAENMKEGWGIFPRAFSQTINILKGRDQPHMLSASAVEFYLGGCSDLLTQEPNAVHIDPDTNEPINATTMEMKSMADLLRYLNLVQKNRTTRGTCMNDSSSRSHAALILTLQQIDADAKTCSQTTFTLVDLGGAERPTKTKEKRFTSTDMVLWDLSKGKEMPTGAQAYIINWELSMIATEIARATEAHRKKRPYAPPRQLATDATRFLSSSFNGSALTCLCLCLSPANINGWETWFSLKWGENVSKLEIDVRGQRPQNIAKATKDAEKEVRIASKDLDGASKNNRFYAKRKFRFDAASKKLSDLHAMTKMMGARSA